MQFASSALLEGRDPAEVIVGGTYPASPTRSPRLSQIPTHEDIARLGIIPTDQQVDAALKDLETGIQRGELHPRRSQRTGDWMLDRCAPYGRYSVSLAAWCCMWLELYLIRFGQNASPRTPSSVLPRFGVRQAGMPVGSGGRECA